MLTRRKTYIKKSKAQKKSSWEKTPNYWNSYQNEIQIDILPPGKGYKHFLKKRDIKLFLEILPNREEIDERFDAVVLDSGSFWCDGWYRNGVIGICAWEKDMTQTYSKSYFDNHKEILDKLEVKYTIKKDYVICDFNEKQIRAFLLLHIFLHELGHHHDKINTKRKKRCGRGEKYAESYALKYEDIIWNKFFEHFAW